MFEFNWNYIAIPLIGFGLLFVWSYYSAQIEQIRLKKLWDELSFRGAYEVEYKLFDDIRAIKLVSPYREDGDMLEIQHFTRSNGKIVTTIHMFTNDEFARLTIEEFIRKTDMNIPFPTRDS